jgi:23S rRNA (pseudouridine1915-N3)-methyltransferase
LKNCLKPVISQQTGFISYYMNIKIIAVGKIREKFILSGVEEFVKRIQPYSSLKIIEIEAETIKSDSQIAKAMKTEGEKILNTLSDNAYIITLDVKGNQLCSETFADKISNINTQGINQLVFIIGGAFGLDQTIKKRADFALSLSKMTLPHQLARLFVLEQIYRAFKIINNEPYHK